jgi:hypothetical protein
MAKTIRVVLTRMKGLTSHTTNAFLNARECPIYFHC